MAPILVYRDLEAYLPVEARSPRGGGGGHSSGSGGHSSGSSSSSGSGKGSSTSSSSSSSSSGSGKTSYSSGSTTSYGSTSRPVYIYNSGSGYYGPAPLWVYIVSGIVGLIILLFLIALIYHSCAERRRSREGHKARIGHVLWKAIEIALFIWAFKAMWRCCCARKRSRTYQKIDEAAGGDNNNHNSWYGASTPAYAPPTQKYEPMSYGGASSGLSPSPPAASSGVFPPLASPASTATEYYGAAAARPVSVSPAPTTVAHPAPVSPLSTPAPSAANPAPPPYAPPAYSPPLEQQQQKHPAQARQPTVATGSATGATYMPGQDAEPLYYP